MFLARFASTERATHGQYSAWLQFVREVNGERAETFGAPELLADVPAPGMLTEKYPTARVIHPREGSDEGVRVVADDDDTSRAFARVARRLGLYFTDLERYS